MINPHILPSTRSRGTGEAPRAKLTRNVGVNVVHGVQDSEICVPPKCHAPLTILVTRGQSWTIKNGKPAATIRVVPGEKVAPKDIAKVRVAGSNPVICSKEVAGQGAARG